MQLRRHARQVVLVRPLPARLELQQRRRARLLGRQRAHVDPDLRLRRLPARRDQADRADLAHRLPRRAALRRSRPPPSSTSTSSARPSPATRTSSSRSSTRARSSTGSSTSRCARSSMQHVLMRQGKMNDLVSFMDTNTSFYGTSVMSTFLGNHDVPRTIHFAEDTPVWTRRVGQRQGSQLVESAGAADQRQRLRAPRARLRRPVDQPRRAAHLLRRRDRPGRRGRSRQPPHDAVEPATRRRRTRCSPRCKKLGTIRAAHTALRRGDRTTLSYGDDTWVYQMVDGTDTVYVAINRSDAAVSVERPAVGHAHRSADRRHADRPDRDACRRAARAS